MSDISEPAGAVRIDAHHHLWHYTAEEFGWLEGELAQLRRNFLPQHFIDTMRGAEVAGAVTVQARQTVQETDWLLEVATMSSSIVGVVGWLPLADETVSLLLEERLPAQKLCGLRHIVQAEPAGFLDGVAFNRGVSALASSGLAYDILIHQHQLPEAIRFVDRHPHQIFVLDHLAKPLIQSGETEPWATHMRDLARRRNVVCKVSGMVTEAGTGWTPEQLKPYFDVALEAFTPHRLMIGSDWPVLLAHCDYARWWALVEQWLAPLSAAEQAAMLGGTCLRTYGLKPPAVST